MTVNICFANRDDYTHDHPGLMCNFGVRSSTNMQTKYGVCLFDEANLHLQM